MNGVGVHGWTSSESEDRSVNTFPTVVRDTPTAYAAMVGPSDLIDLPADLPAATDVASDLWAETGERTQPASSARSDEASLAPGSPP